MNRKGFTLIELLCTIIFVSVIAVVLIEIVLSLKQLYDTSGIKTELLNKQAIISHNINNTLLMNSFTSITKCGDNCIEFLTSDGNILKLDVDRENNMISFGNFKTVIKKYSYFGKVEINNVVANFKYPSNFDGIVNIKIPIISDRFPDKDFGLNIVYQYNSNYTTVNVN